MFVLQTSTPDSQASKPNTRRAVSDTAATRKPSSSTPPVVSSSSSKPRLWSPTAEPLSPLTPLPPVPHPKTRRNPDYQAVTPWTYRRPTKLAVPFGAPPTLPNFANANLGLNMWCRVTGITLRYPVTYDRGIRLLYRLHYDIRLPPSKKSTISWAQLQWWGNPGLHQARWKSDSKHNQKRGFPAVTVAPSGMNTTMGWAAEGA